MSAKDKARERAGAFFSANRSVIKRLVEAENDLGFHHAKLQEELESDFAAALLQARREALEEAAKLMVAKMLELRVLVICANCKNKIEVFAEGSDVNKNTGEDLAQAIRKRLEE